MDDDWFARKILVHEPRLRGRLRRFFPSPWELDDIVQEAYARLLSLEPIQRERVRVPFAFLLTTARNLAVDRLRRQPLVSLDLLVELESLDVMSDSPGVVEDLAAREELALLQEALSSLPERCREVMVLRKIHSLSQREVALKLAISESTVEKHVSNGVRLCAAYLADRGAMKGGEAESRGKSGSIAQRRR